MRIQQFPQGLIDLLNIKLGRKPLENLLEDVRPTMDTTDSYSIRQMEHNGVSSATFAAAGNSLAFTVPEGQIWFVYAFGFDITVADAGDIVQIALELLNGTLRVPCAPMSQVFTAPVGGMRILEGKTFTRPVLLQPGDSLLASVPQFAITAPSATGSVRARFARVGPDSKQIFA